PARVAVRRSRDRGPHGARARTHARPAALPVPQHQRLCADPFPGCGAARRAGPRRCLLQPAGRRVVDALRRRAADRREPGGFPLPGRLPADARPPAAGPALMRKDILALDAEAEIERIAQSLRAQVLGEFRRRGAVMGLSGGIDSSVVAALCVRAFGIDKVLGLFMPERHSSDDALSLGRMLADSLGIEAIVEDVAPALEGLGCYRRQDEAIRSIVPQYGEGWKCKLVLPSILEAGRLNVTRLTVQSPAGEVTTVRLTPSAYLQIVAATNYKQRVRKMTEYYHADRLNYAVAGTPNRLEYDQGFFVKQGDGAADVK